MQSNNHEAIQKIPSEQLAKGYKELEEESYSFDTAYGPLQYWCNP